MFKDSSEMFEDFGFKQVDINSLLGKDISFIKGLAYEKAGNSKNSSGNRKVPCLYG